MQHTWITRHEDNPDVWDDPDGVEDNEPSDWARHAPDPHNGPKCRDCGFNFCMHCHPEGWDDDNCGHATPLRSEPAYASFADAFAGILTEAPEGV
jgi:hypothetical protein